jgi:hypothetical protein
MSRGAGTVVMCEKCAEIDARMARYRSLRGAVTDKLTLEGIDRLIADLESQKIALHPKPKG